MALKSTSFQPDQSIIREGEYGSEMYFIARGETVVTKDKKELARLKSGDFFGELSLLYAERRNATITAQVYCHLYCLTQEAFETMAVAFPTWWESINDNKSLFKRATPAPVSAESASGAPARAVRSSVHGLLLPSAVTETSIAIAAATAATAATAAASPTTATTTSPPLTVSAISAPPVEKPPEVKLQEKLEELLDEKKCLICTDRLRNTLIVPCGHISVCELCVTPLRKCPICRGPIEKTMKAFF